MEEWKHIIGYERYMISSFGRVRGLRGGVLTPYISGGGGLKVALHTDKFYVHRLVAIHFLGASDLEVDHIDGNKHNNHISNLRWVSGAENLRLAREEQGLLSFENKKVQWGDVVFPSIRELARHIAETFGIKSETARKALQGVKYGKKTYKGKALILLE